MNQQNKKNTGIQKEIGEPVKTSKDYANQKKSDTINRMSDKELVEQLKTKGIESFGTKGEKVERLKKHYGCLRLNEASSRSIRVRSIRRPIASRKSRR